MVDEQAPHGKGKPRSKQKLSLLQWTAAFDRYAVAAASCGQMSYASALAHKDVVLQVRDMFIKGDGRYSVLQMGIDKKLFKSDILMFF